MRSFDTGVESDWTRSGKFSSEHKTQHLSQSSSIEDSTLIGIEVSLRTKDESVSDSKEEESWGREAAGGIDRLVFSLSVARHTAVWKIERENVA